MNWEAPLTGWCGLLNDRPAVVCGFKTDIDLGVKRLTTSVFIKAPGDWRRQKFEALIDVDASGCAKATSSAEVALKESFADGITQFGLLNYWTNPPSGFVIPSLSLFNTVIKASRPVPRAVQRGGAHSCEAGIEPFCK